MLSVIAPRRRPQAKLSPSRMVPLYQIPFVSFSLFAACDFLQTVFRCVIQLWRCVDSLMAPRYLDWSTTSGAVATKQCSCPNSGSLSTLP